jgi:hypothetical protein
MRIKLTLGRTREAPNGDPRHGYEFIAPLNAQGHVDALAWTQCREHCVVRSFRPGQADKQGHLRHLGHGWRFDFGPERAGADEPLFKLDKHLIARNLYLTITEDNGVQQPFRIVAVTPLKEAA